MPASLPAGAEDRLARFDVWHRMGDVGYMDDQGRFWYCGRMSQRVETAGGTLFTECVEAVFNTHSAVRRSALVGVGPLGQQQPVLVRAVRILVRRAAVVDDVVVQELPVAGLERGDGRPGLAHARHGLGQHLLVALDVARHRARVEDPGGGDEHVDAPEPLDRRLRHRLVVRPARRVEVVSEGLPSPLLDEGDGLGGVEDVGHHHVRPFLGEAHATRAADAVGASGDDRRATFQASGHVPASSGHGMTSIPSSASSCWRGLAPRAARSRRPLRNKAIIGIDFTS